MLVIFMFSFTKGKAPLRNLFYLWIATFHIGPRAEEFIGMKIFFVEGVTWLLFFLYLLRSNFYLTYKGLLPKYTGIFFAFCALGVVVACLYQRNYNVVIYELKVFICLLPVFYITHFAFKHLNVSLDSIVKIFAVGCLILAAGGVLTYFLPSLASYFPKSADSVLLSNVITEVKLGEQVLVRGGASFWGLLIIAAYLALMFFPVFARGKVLHAPTGKFFKLLVLALMVTNIILNGHRSVWVGLLLGIAFYAYLRGAKAIFKAFMLLAVMFSFLPQSVYLRFLSTADQTAWAGRVERYDYAMAVMRDNPIFGAGWGAAGWTHNFVLQMGANLGVFGVLVFLFWLGKIFFTSLNIFKKNIYSGSMREYQLAFLTGFVVYLGPMLGESIITWTFMMIPFWFFCAVLHNFNIGAIDQDNA